MCSLYLILWVIWGDSINTEKCMCSFTAQLSLVGQGLFISDTLLHSDKSHSVGLPWTSDQPDTETSTWQHTTLTTERHFPRRGRNRKPSKQVVADPRLRPRGQRDRSIYHKKKKVPVNVVWNWQSAFSCQYQISNYWCPPIHHFAKTSPHMPVLYPTLQYMKVCNY